MIAEAETLARTVRDFCEVAQRTPSSDARSFMVGARVRLNEIGEIIREATVGIELQRILGPLIGSGSARISARSFDLPPAPMRREGNRPQGGSLS